MCGRFTLTTKDFRELARALDVPLPAGYGQSYRPRYNVAPTDQHWLVRVKHEERELLPAKWGLVNSWATDAKSAARQINCRSETALSKPAFRDAFVNRRCIVPADGFFEWTGEKQNRRPLWFHPPEQEHLILFAALYEKWLDPASSEWQRTFTILTTSANDVVAPVHDRMPVILDPDTVDEWLHIPASNAESHAQNVAALLRPAATETLIATAVSPRANSVANDDAECLLPFVADAPLQPALL